MRECFGVSLKMSWPLLMVSLLMPAARSGAEEGTESHTGFQLTPDLKSRFEKSVGELLPLKVRWKVKRTFLNLDLLKQALNKTPWKNCVDQYLIKFTTLRTDVVAVSRTGFIGKHRETFTHFKRRSDSCLEVPNSWETAFNGTDLFLGTSEFVTVGDKGMTVDSLEHFKAHDPESCYWNFDFFTASGYVLPKTARHLGTPPLSLVLDLAARGEVEEIGEDNSAAGTPMQLSLKTANRRYIIEVDPQREYCVLKWREEQLDGKLLVMYECTNFVKVPSRDLWLPQRCKISYCFYDWLPQVVYDSAVSVDELEVTDTAFEPVAESQFELMYSESGMVISDGRLPGSWQSDRERISYRIPSDKGDLEAVIQRAIDGEQINVRVRGLWRTVFIVVNVGILVLIVVLIYRKRHRQSRLAS